MYVKYRAEEGESRVWESESREVFSHINGLPYYKEQVFFYPSEPEESVWLWMVGHEICDPKKLVQGRMWRTRWVLHLCVGGKGFYNGQPVQKGSAFLCWPHLVHSLQPDPENPLEYYWLMLRGKDVLPFVREYGFSSGELIFECSYIDQVLPLFEVALQNDYTKTDLTEFTTSLRRMILSFHRFSLQNRSEVLPSGKYYVNYVDSAKNLLYDHNYTLTVSQLSGMLGITSKHLDRVFRKTVGESPKQYITRKRLELSIHLLRGGMLPTEVSVMLKYSDYTSFYRAFLQKFQIPPSKYLSGK